MTALRTAFPTIVLVAWSLLPQPGQAAPATHYHVTTDAMPVSYSNVQIFIDALDAADNVDSSYNGSAIISSSDPSFIGAGNVVTLTNGSANFNGYAFKTAGPQTVTATDTTHSAITGSMAVTVIPGATVQFHVSGPINVVAGVPFAITVHSTDLYGNFTSDYNGTTQLTSDDPRAVLPGNVTVANGSSNGLAMATLKTAGEFQLIATDTTNAGMAGSGVFEVAPGPTSRFTLSLPASVDPGVEFYFDVQSYDAFLNTTDYTGTLHFTSNDPGATLPADSTLDFGAGTFPATFIAPNATRTITATDTVNPGVTGTGATGTTPVTLQSFDVE